MRTTSKRGELPSPTSNGSQEYKITDAAALTAALQNRGDRSFRLALTTSEAAAALGISVRTLHRLSSERKLIKPSRALRTKTWAVAELVRFLEQTAA